MHRELTPAQRKTFEVIFGTESYWGRRFDIALIALILASVLIVLLDSIPEYQTDYGHWFWNIELGFTFIFTMEYALRLWCSPNRKRYALSTFGIVDLLAIIPTYVALFMPQASSLLLIRLIRVLRVFRVFKLLSFMREANTLSRSLMNSRRKILIFFCSMFVLTMVFGCLMYVIEGPANGFSTIPKSIYWAIVTITTVGYGDVVPQTPLGQAIAAAGMLTGYAIIAVPTGIITAELAQELGRERSRINCKNCERAGHDNDARYCKFCGSKL